MAVGSVIAALVIILVLWWLLQGSGHERSMIVTILIWTLVLVLIGLVIIWAILGGFTAAWNVMRNFTNPIDIIFGRTGTTTGTLITLPWQPSELRGPDIGAYADEARKVNGEDYDEQASTQPSSPSQLGSRSLYARQVTLGDGDATSDDPSTEYLELSASGNNVEPLAVSGWSLQSAATGQRVYIPQGTATLTVGAVNQSLPIYLEPGESAIVITGNSPVGISFKENLCTGYLGQTQRFTPELESACPYGSEILQQTEANIRTYGASCFDYLRSLQRCAQAPEASSDITSACRALAANALTYNGCVNGYRTVPNFSLPRWRIFLGRGQELWGNAHDVIRLLDQNERTVDVLTY